MPSVDGLFLTKTPHNRHNPVLGRWIKTFISDIMKRKKAPQKLRVIQNTGVYDMNYAGELGKDEAIDRCTKHFNEGYNCCETMLLSFGELLGVESEVIPKIATPFGGGIYNRKHMCGALSGAVMAIGLKYGRNTPGGKREPSSERAARLVEKFTEKYESANCIGVLGYDPNDLEKIKRDKDKIRANICSPLIRQVAEWLWDEIK
ncbi:MAG TPA: C-GCAxxG-C-C family protein [Clostridia bacterium]|nr:C-GCAxxG-C-C family protein [Clostridia bacterium]